jgi:hypothetical protein
MTNISSMTVKPAAALGMQPPFLMQEMLRTGAAARQRRATGGWKGGADGVAAARRSAQVHAAPRRSMGRYNRGLVARTLFNTLV